MSRITKIYYLCWYFKIVYFHSQPIFRLDYLEITFRHFHYLCPRKFNLLCKHFEMFWFRLASKSIGWRASLAVANNRLIFSNLRIESFIFYQQWIPLWSFRNGFISSGSHKKFCLCDGISLPLYVYILAKISWPNFNSLKLIWSLRSEC